MLLIACLRNGIKMPAALNFSMARMLACAKLPQVVVGIPILTVLHSSRHSSYCRRVPHYPRFAIVAEAKIGVIYGKHNPAPSTGIEAGHHF